MAAKGKSSRKRTGGAKKRSETRVGGLDDLKAALNTGKSASPATSMANPGPRSKVVVTRTPAPDVDASAPPTRKQTRSPAAYLMRKAGAQPAAKSAGSTWASSARTWVVEPRRVDGDTVCPRGLRLAQLSDSSSGAERPLRELVIGLDFGTSSTKVAIRDTSLYKARVSSFGQYGHPEAPCLFPTSVCINDQGLFGIGGGLEIAALKDRFMKDPEGIVQFSDSELQMTALALCVGYLAITLRIAVQDYLNVRRKELESLELVWTMNLGLPARDHQNASLVENYHLLGLAAWAAALGNDDVNLPVIYRALSAARVDLDGFRREGNPGPAIDGMLAVTDLRVVPEVVAETTGYCESDRAREGRVHVLIDVGATTVDLCVFLLDAKHRLMQVAEVQPLGLQQLHHRRMAAVRESLRQQLHGLSYDVSPMDALPEEAEYLFTDEAVVRNVAEGFRREFVRAFSAVITAAKAQQQDRRAWQGGVPMLVYGGGSKDKLYRTVLGNLRKAENARTYGVTDGYELVRHARPDDLEFSADCRADFLRFAVAYGLSFQAGSSDKYKPAKPISPKDAPSPGYRDLYIDKDQV